jgi:subtilase family serine protease
MMYHSSRFKTGFSVLFCVIGLGFQGLSAQSPLKKVRIRPAIHWKYGWLDGVHANATGSVRNNDPLPALESAPCSGYTPADIASAYGFNLIPTNGDGTGQVIALTEAFGSPTLQSDLDVFCRNFNLPKTTVEIRYPEGQPTTNDIKEAGWGDVSGWASETMLDVEWAHATAPGAKIVVIVAPNDLNLDQGIIKDATNAGAGFVSMSWSTTEDQYSMTDPILGYKGWFTNTNIVYVSSAGDNRSSVEWPGADSNVLSVGGTSLYTNQTGAFWEAGWSGSGGGVSRYEPMPSYQAGWFSQGGGERCVPDVSFNANPYTGFSTYMTDPRTHKGGWFVAGGTSAGAPQWAALLACRASLGNPKVCPIQSKLYDSNGYGKNFFDIVSGNNGYPTAIGYDLMTGLGSPVAYAIAAPSLAGTNSPAINKRNQSIVFGKLPVKTYPAISFPISATTTSGLPITFTSSRTDVATVSNNLVTIMGSGSTVITAGQLGNTDWSPATPVLQTLVVQKGTPVLRFVSATILTNSSSAPIALPLTNSSGLVPTFKSSATNVAVISSMSATNCILTVRCAGIATITASVAGNDWRAAVTRCLVEVKK